MVAKTISTVWALQLLLEKVSKTRLSNFCTEMIKSCQLVCVNNTHDPIQLPDGHPVVVGRSPQTRIIDPRCSRHQIEVTSNWKKRQVTVKQIGANNGAIDGTELEVGRMCTLQTGATLYLLTGQYPHKVEFSVDKDNREHVKLEKVNKEVPHAGKRPASSDLDTNENSKPFKIQKLDSSSSSKNKNGDDEDRIKSVEEKLKFLKQSAKEDKNKKKIDSHSESKHSKDKSSSHSEGKHGKERHNSQSDKKEGAPATATKWTQFDKLYVCNMKGVTARSKIAGFDIDGTIITTQSGNVFPKHAGDWRILYPEIPGKLKKLHADGYKVVFFTNQMGVAKGKQKIEDLQNKFVFVAEKIGVPVQILVSTGGGLFRKPCLGMWNHLREKDNEGIRVNKEESFYVGDAAGRPEKWAPKRKKDFSLSDRLFAMNAGLTFYTPEEYFMGQSKAPFNMPEFDPKSVSSSDKLTIPNDAKIISTKKEVVVLVGFPGSGKSFFANTYMVTKGYDYVNRDTLGSWQKCVNACIRSLKEGSSVVVDNTNPDVESRARYIDCAKKAGVQCRCFQFTTSHYQARHNEKFRQITDKTHQPINDMMMNVYKNKYKEPKLSEGFTEIIKINFVPKFENVQHERLYKQYLIEK